MGVGASTPVAAGIPRDPGATRRDVTMRG
ncbi:MAG: hypothetical protein RLZZ353_1518, partial [Actinomycetota bacterium]